MIFRAKFISIQGMPLNIPEMFYGTDCLTKLMIIKGLSIDDISKINNFVPPEHREHTICVNPSVANEIKPFKPVSIVLITVPTSSLNLIAELKFVKDPYEPFLLDRAPHFQWTVDDDTLMSIWKVSGYDIVIDPEFFKPYRPDYKDD